MATGISSSASVSYATQLAQTSALKRSLYNLGMAVQNGDLTSANSILSAIIKANPQYASNSSDGSQSQAPINQDFQALAGAIANNQVDAAKSAWTKVQGDLSKNGVTDLNDGTAATAELLAQTKASIVQQLVSDAFGTSSGRSSSVTSLIGGTDGSTSEPGLSSSLISGWLTYRLGGQALPAVPTSSGGSYLDTSA